MVTHIEKERPKLLHSVMWLPSIELKVHQSSISFIRREKDSANDMSEDPGQAEAVCQATDSWLAWPEGWGTE